MGEKNFISKGESSDRFISVTDKKHQIIYSNQYFLKEFQFSEDDIFNKSLYSVFSFTENGSVLSKNGDTPRIRKATGTRKDGSKCKLNIFVKPLQDDTGESYGYEYVAQKDSGSETFIDFKAILSQLEHTYKTFPDILILINNQGLINKFIICSPLYNQFEYYTANQKIETIFGKDVSLKLYECIHNLKKKDKVITEEFLETVNKTQKIFEIRLSLLTGEHIAVVIRDITKFKIAEKELRKLESRLRSIWNHSQDGMRLIDSCGKIISVNQAFCNLVGMDSEDLLGKPFYCIYTKDYEKEYIGALDRIQSSLTKKNFNSYFEGYVKLSNGKEKILRIDNSLIEVPSDMPLFENEIFMLSIFKDVTDFEKTQEENYTYNQALEHSGDGIMFYNKNKVITYANPSISNLLQLDREEIVDKLITVLLKKILVSKKAYSNIIENHTLKEEVLLKRKNGSHILAEISNNHLYNDAGQLENNILIIRDISERKNAEEALRYSAIRLRAVWESTNDGFILSGSCGNIIDVNSTLCKMAGIDAGELIGHPFLDMLDLDSEKLVEEQKKYKKFFEGKKFLKSRVSQKFRNGKEYFLLVSHSLINIENQEPLLLTVYHDLTNQKEKETELHKLESLAKIGEKSAQLSHELKNPLSAVKNYIQILSESQTLSEKEKEAIMLMEAEVIHLNMLLKDVLEFARFQKFVFKDINLREVFERIKALKQPLLTKKQIELNIFVDEVIQIKGDYCNILSVFSNLIENSIDAISSNGLIEISAAYSNARLKIYIKDNGCGISDPDKVFDPFFSTKSSGTGLGLSIVKKIVQQHDGEIKILKSAPGLTVFEIIFN